MNLSQAQLKELEVLKWLKKKRNKPMSQKVNKNVKAPNAFYEQNCKPYQFNDVPLELLKIISISDMSEQFVHKDCYLKLTIIKPCFKVIAIHSRVQDHEGNEVDISFYNFNKKKDCRALFPVGTVIFVKEPYYHTAAQGNKNIRIDNPRDVEFESERLLNQTLEQKYRRQGRELMEDRQYVEAYLLYHQAIGKTNGSRESNRFLLDKAIACYHLNLYQDYLSHAELVVQFEPSNIEAYCHIFKALIMLGKFKKAQKLLEEKAEYFEKDTVKELRLFSEEVKKTKENHINWQSAFIKNNILGNYLSPKIKNQKTKKGFGIIAQETIEPGEILIIEQPFLFINLEEAPDQQNPIFNENSIAMHYYCSNLYAQSKNFRIKLNDFAAKHGIIPQQEGQSTEDKFSPHQKFKIIDKNSVSLNQLYDYFFPIGSKRLRRNNCGLFETVNMINHSCEENVERFCIGNTIIVFATFKIQKDEEILMDYKKSWENSKSDMYLSRQNCECQLCTIMAAIAKKGQTYLKGMSRQMDRQNLMFELNQIQSKDPNKFARLIQYYDFQTMAFYYRKTGDMFTVAKMFTRVFQMDQFISISILNDEVQKMFDQYKREEDIKNKQPRKPGFVSDDHTQTPFFREHIENVLKQDPLPLDQLIAQYVNDQQKRRNIKYWPKICPAYPIKPFSQAFLADLSPVMIQQLSEMMAHKGCYLKVTFVRDSLQREAIVGRVKDQQGTEIDINIHNFDTKGKNCSTIFKKGTTIFIKEPYCKIKEEGNPSPKIIRIDNPRDIQFQVKKVSEAEKYRQKGVKLVKQKKYLEAYLLYDQALKKIDDHQMTISFLLNKAIVSFHLNLLHDYYDSTCIVLQFNPTNIKALYHKFKALVLLNDENQAVELMQGKKQHFTADHLKEMKEFLEKVRMTRENKVDWYTAIKTQNILGEYFSDQISIEKTKEEFGIFTKEKIPPGKILIIEKSFFYSETFMNSSKNYVIFSKGTYQIQSQFKKLFSISKDFRSKINSIINLKQLQKKESSWLEENVSERCPQTLTQKINKRCVLFNPLYGWLRQNNQQLPMTQAGLFEKSSLIKNCSNKENIDQTCLGNIIITYTIKEIPKGGELIASFFKTWFNQIMKGKKKNSSIPQQISKHYDTTAMGLIIRLFGKNSEDIITQTSKMLRRVFPMTESQSKDIIKKCSQK